MPHLAGEGPDAFGGHVKFLQ